MRDDPSGFVRHPELLLLDEVQRVPDLLLAVKNEVDQDPRPGRFLLTGSARLLGLREIPDALTGRAETVELWPLSQGEIDSRPDRLVDAIFRHGADYVERAMRGGYPEAVRRPAGRRRARFLDS